MTTVRAKDTCTEHVASLVSLWLTINGKQLSYLSLHYIDQGKSQTIFEQRVFTSESKTNKTMK